MRAIYREAGGKFIVDVLSDTTKDGVRAVHLRLVSVIRSAPGFKDPEEEWVSECHVGYELIVGWSLSVLQ